MILMATVAGGHPGGQAGPHPPQAAVGRLRGGGWSALLDHVRRRHARRRIVGTALARTASRSALWSVIAGSLMTGLLPFIESLFGVQTDLSLLTGRRGPSAVAGTGPPCAGHLQPLDHRGLDRRGRRRERSAPRACWSASAPTSTTSARCSSRATSSRTKAHGDNRHESLVPAMSTLIIIAHVKDGADLARQHHLPEPIIDFIEQHHGTTLVEYFYRQANEQNEGQDPDGGDVDESAFRYPGPKPQTREAAVLMLADAVESASRALVEPTPARIENLVQDISMKRLLDGQFDECGLTLEEVRTIDDSLVKSLTAVYHGRVKYPGQETA